jgi:hypothetical protein
MRALTNEIVAEVNFRRASRVAKCPRPYDLFRIVEIKDASGKQVRSATNIGQLVGMTVGELERFVSNG